MKSPDSLSKIYCMILCLIPKSVGQEDNFSATGPNTSLTIGNRPIYLLVDWYVETPQWLKTDTFECPENPKVQKLLRCPPEELRHGFTLTNQELVALSTKESQLVPSAGKLLQAKKAPTRFFHRSDYQPILSTGINARHRFAEGLHIRWRSIGATDESLIGFLYMPIGWPLVLIITFLCFIVLIPITGAFLVHASFAVAGIFNIFFYAPLKTALRWLFIRERLSNQRWQKYIAPPYFLEPRPAWKIPSFLRENADSEDIPDELVYKPPVNKVDYTMYILTEEDYDDMDLGMDEQEYIDDLLQFRDSNPKTVARLLKHRLGVEKFYHYFDEDILSDGSDDEEKEPPTKSPEETAEKSEGEFDYLKLLEVDEPWMHDEYDATFTGPSYALEEVRKRRQVIHQLKDEIKYLHALSKAEDKYDKNYQLASTKERKNAKKRAERVMDKFVRFSNITKERIAEIEPSSKTQTENNPALSKYLPLIDQMSHYNHRLNLKHEKQKDSAKRALQLDIFGGL